MSNTISINCRRCGSDTKVTLNMSVSSQRCQTCGNFLYSADTGVNPIVRKRARKRTWRSLATTQRSQEMADSIDPDSIQHDRKASTLWMPLTIAVAAVLVIFVTHHAINRESQRAEREGTGKDVVLQTSLAGRDIAAEKRAIMGDFTPVTQGIDPVWAAKVADVAQRYLTTVQVADILKLTRNGAKFEKEITAKLGKTGALPLSNTGVDDILHTVSEDGEKTPLGLLFFLNRSEEMQGIVLVETPEGIQVDWPSLSGLGDVSLETFLAEKPTEPTLIRVAARRIDYYNFDFGSQDKLLALRMTEFPEQNVVYGYVKEGTPLYDRLSGLPVHDTNLPEALLPRPRPLTLRAQFRPESKSPNQVEVLEVLGNGWYVK